MIAGKRESRGAREQGSKIAREQESRGTGEQYSRKAGKQEAGEQEQDIRRARYRQ